MSDRFLAELQTTIEREIPMCAMMGIEVDSYDHRGLTLHAPLRQNYNHQGTAFAGSLNALCTMAGWGHVFLLHRIHGLTGDIVICRSSIKYLKPVASDQICACCHHVGDRERDHFLEMFRAKGQAKIDVRVEIVSAEVTAVAFSGAYVITERPADLPASESERNVWHTLDRPQRDQIKSTGRSSRE
ncbi:MAG: YiiD C-terminal domain-containing protein [Pirellulales bacterium]